MPVPAWRSLCSAGGSGAPTTTSRPSAVRSTSMGAPYRRVSVSPVDHLSGGRRLTAPPGAEVDDPVQVAEDRVHVMGDQQHR